MLYPNFVYMRTENTIYSVVVNSEEEKKSLKYFNDKWTDSIKFEQLTYQKALSIIKDIELGEKVDVEKKEVEPIEQKTYIIKDMTWHELRAYAKRLESELGDDIITRGASREDIENRIKELTDGDSAGLNN